MAQTSKLPSLKDSYQNDFLVDVAINIPQIEGKDSTAVNLIMQQFNAVTPENVMKAQLLQPGWNIYDFDVQDKLVAFVQKTHLKVNTHNLIWRSQLPSLYSICRMLIESRNRMRTPTVKEWKYQFTALQLLK